MSMDDVTHDDDVDETDGDGGGEDDGPPMPYDEASFEAYLKHHVDDQYCATLEMSDVRRRGDGYTASITGESDLISEMRDRRAYLAERKGWFRSAVLGSGTFAGLNMQIVGTTRTMGDAVDVSDEMEVEIWAGVGDVPRDVVEAFALRYETTVVSQRFSDVARAVREMMLLSDQAIATVIAEGGNWVTDPVNDLNAIMSRNVT